MGDRKNSVQQARITGSKPNFEQSLVAANIAITMQGTDKISIIEFV
jgi:hypothetical protein